MVLAKIRGIQHDRNRIHQSTFENAMSAHATLSAGMLEYRFALLPPRRGPYRLRERGRKRKRSWEEGRQRISRARAIPSEGGTVGGSRKSRQSKETHKNSLGNSMS